MKHKTTLPNGAEVTASLHNNLVIIQVQDDPKSWERPVFQNADEMQDVKMMFFQHKLQYALLSEMRRQGLQVFQTEVDIHINIRSKQSFLELQLEYVLKAILDACNKYIIDDDRLIRNVIIDASSAINKQIKSDSLGMVIADNKGIQKLSWSGDLSLVEKRLPIAKKIGARSIYNQKQLTYQNDLYQAMAVVLQPFKYAGANRKIECHLRFDTPNHLQDSDNMALMYLPVIRKLLIPFQDQLHSIGLYKRHSNTTRDNGTKINLLLGNVYP